jgi:hypothetical protein
VSSDPFSAAGENLRRECIRDDAARDQAISALNDLADFCVDGIQRFYGSERTDVYVERRCPSQVSIQFGYRPGSVHRVMHGPWAALFATPSGTLLWASFAGWGPPGEPTPSLDAEPLDAADYRASLTPKLIAFLRDSEQAYRNAPA